MRRIILGATAALALAASVCAQDAGTAGKTEKIVEEINTTAQQTRSMLQDLLLANSQSMFELQSMAGTVDGMKKQLKEHSKVGYVELDRSNDLRI